ncbi:MAG: nuclear transport factor 2 family protein [Candidatus Limnocylindrales bacterium]
MPNDLTPGDGQDLFASFKRAWEGRDPDAMLELFSEHAEYRADPFLEPMRGLVAIREHWNAIAAAQDHVEFDAERVWVSGRTVLGSWHAALTERATAERVRVRGFSTMELDDQGRIVRLREWRLRRVVGIDSSYRRRAASAGE